jgi:hypothetical protein
MRTALPGCVRILSSRRGACSGTPGAARGGLGIVGAVIVGAAVAGAVLAGVAWATSDGQFTMLRHVIGSGGGRAFSSERAVHGTIGQSALGLAADADHHVWGGFWPGLRTAPTTATPTLGATATPGGGATVTASPRSPTGTATPAGPDITVTPTPAGPDVTATPTSTIGQPLFVPIAAQGHTVGSTRE